VRKSSRQFDLTTGSHVFDLKELGDRTMGSIEQTSYALESLLVERNLRGMAEVKPALKPGYSLRAACLLADIATTQGCIFIGTGFPVTDTFETDGPVGAIALYEALEKLGAKPVIVCGPPLSDAIANDYRVEHLQLGTSHDRVVEAKTALAKWQPQLLLSIERPGMAADGGYYNMRGEDISPRTACFDSFMLECECPTIAIGDGGNEIGMGNVTAALENLNIVPASTKCDELVIADVSNWGGYGLIALLGQMEERDLLAEISPIKILQYLSNLGSVDGVTRLNQLTEDGLDASAGDELILKLRQITGFA